MIVAADDRLFVLQRQGGDPDVVFWDRSALRTQIFSHMGVEVGCVLIDQQHVGFLDQRCKEELQMLAMTRPEEPEPILTYSPMTMTGR